MKVSIIVPVYNEITTLEKCLSGLRNINLGYQNIEKEIILVEGNSTDGSRDVVKKYENVDVSIAVALKDGLITPIIKNADTKGLVEISQ